MEKRTLLDAFDDVFTSEIRTAKSNEEAYSRASDRFEREHGFIAFNGYDSFRKKKSRKRKRL